MAYDPMTWRELVDAINKNLPDAEWDRPAILFDYSDKHNPDGNFCEIKGLEPWDLDENPPRDFSIVYNSDNWF